MSNPPAQKADAEKAARQPVYSIDGQDFKKLFKASLSWLKSNQQLINSLNVFPVPDGDTGTNMFLTLQSAYTEIEKSSEHNIGKITKLIAQGALMGARGNSGVILSQLLRGFSRVLDEKDSMDIQLLSAALQESRNTAYKGVVRPVEGTILTVAKDVAAAAEAELTKPIDLIDFLEKIVESADRSVKLTPDLLPILKQAGVVDSGGKGLFFILEGMLRHAHGLPVELVMADSFAKPIDLLNMQNTELHESIEEGQDFEIVVDFVPNGELNLPAFYEGLSSIGTSIQVGEGDDTYRMHIHVPTENKYEPIDYVANFGVIRKVYIENLLEQMAGNKNEDEDFSNPIDANQIAVIAVSPGKGISKIFKSLGVTRVIVGGQTMNPSTEEILASFEDLPTDKIIILPNNKNIILAAQTSTQMSTKNIRVIPSRSVPQGLAACLRYNTLANLDELEKEMTEALGEVDTGEITTATRSIKMNGVNVREGEVIGLLNGNLITSNHTIKDSSLALLEKANAKEKEHITIFYGSDINKKDLDHNIDAIKQIFPKQEIEVHEGGQPHYHLIFSIE